jgi:hypothetical protein
MAKQTFTTGQVLTAAQMTSLQQTAMLGGAASAKTASYTLVAADAGTAISMSSASATTITVNTALFAAGDTVQITNLGAGVCTITAGTATVNTSASLALAQYESGTLDFTSTSAAIFIKGAGAAATFNVGYAYTASTQTTSSSSYVDLSTTTSTTVTTGTKALVSIKSALGNEALGAGVWGHVSFAVSGATTLAASDERSISSYSTLGSQWINEMGATFVVEGLTAGSNTFTLKFNAQGGYTTPATFYKRSISVVNLGS